MGFALPSTRHPLTPFGGGGGVPQREEVAKKMGPTNWSQYFLSFKILEKMLLCLFWTNPNPNASLRPPKPRRQEERTPPPQGAWGGMGERCPAGHCAREGGRRRRGRRGGRPPRGPGATGARTAPVPPRWSAARIREKEGGGGGWRTHRPMHRGGWSSSNTDGLSPGWDWRGLGRGSPIPLGKPLRGFAGIRGYGHVVIATLFFCWGGIRLALTGEGEGGTTGVPPDPPGQRIMHGCDGFARRPTTLFPKNITEWRAGAWYAFY